MSNPVIKTFLDDMVSRDEQGQLILQIDALAYRINQAQIADVQVRHHIHSLHVVVKRAGFGGEQLLNAALGIALPADESDWSRATLCRRLRDVVVSMQKIFDAGIAPRDGAA